MSNKIDTILRNPKSIRSLAMEIRKLLDGYWSREITEDDVNSYITFWAETEKDKLFKNNDINPTIKILIAKKRTELLKKLLNGSHITF